MAYSQQGRNGNGSEVFLLQHDLLDLIECDLIIPTIIELDRACALMRGHLLRVLPFMRLRTITWQPPFDRLRFSRLPGWGSQFVGRLGGRSLRRLGWASGCLLTKLPLGCVTQSHGLVQSFLGLFASCTLNTNRLAVRQLPMREPRLEGLNGNQRLAKGTLSAGACRSLRVKSGFHSRHHPVPWGEVSVQLTAAVHHDDWDFAVLDETPPLSNLIWSQL